MTERRNKGNLEYIKANWRRILAISGLVLAMVPLPKCLVTGGGGDDPGGKAKPTLQLDDIEQMVRGTPEPSE